MNNEQADFVIKDFTCIKMSENKYLYLYGPVYFPLLLDSVDVYKFKWYVWKTGEEEINGEDFLKIYAKDTGVNCDSVLVYGDVFADNFFIRIHSGCITGDVFHSAKCDCGFQLNTALKEIVNNKAGMVVYISSQEGRGIGLFAKAICNKLQEHGMDTYGANNCLGYEDDERNFDEAAAIIKHFREGKPIILLSNNPLKSNWLLNHSIEVGEIRRLTVKVNEENRSYLLAKKNRGENIVGIV